jgi:hypothetical protein
MANTCPYGQVFSNAGQVPSLTCSGAVAIVQMRGFRHFLCGNVFFAHGRLQKMIGVSADSRNPCSIALSHETYALLEAFEQPRSPLNMRKKYYRVQSTFLK